MILLRVETGTVAHAFLSFAPFFPPDEVHVLFSRLVSLIFAARNSRSTFLVAAFSLLATIPIYAASGGSISGTVADPSGALIVGATLKLVNTGQRTVWQAASDKQGLYSFPNLPVGR